MKLSPKQTAKVMALADKPRRRKPASKPVSVTVLTRVVSEANRREHWAVPMRRKHEQWAALAVALFGIEHPSPPVAVTWVHIGRRMDDDNLARAFKGLRDGLATAIGVDDGDESAVTWRYEQRTGKPGVELRIENRKDS